MTAFSPPRSRLAGLLPATFIAATAATGASAHEAWLLTPSEVAALSQMPMPALFTSPAALGLAAAIGCAVSLAALRIESHTSPLEERLAAPIAAWAPSLGTLAVRLGLASMLGLAAFGGLPRHGTEIWAQPTLMVPDMQLALAPGWSWLASAEAALAMVLAFGILTRLAGLALVALALLGVAAFGMPFMNYAPHFIAPGLILVACGGGAFSLDRLFGAEGLLHPGAGPARWIWAACPALLGGCFVWLAITVKLTQPTLVMAIMEHGEVPRLGLSLPLAALVMTGVELIAGLLLAIGRLIRPIALFLMGAFSFFAVTIGETPLMHANLYGAMLILAMAGRTLPLAQPRAPRAQPILN